MDELIYIDLGRRNYTSTLDLQFKLVNDVYAANSNTEYLLLVEHDPPVITLGRSAKENHILLKEDELSARGIEIHKTNRGGDVTFHGHGQVVGYPIIFLQRHNKGIKDYLRDIEQIIMNTLAAFGIKGDRKAGLTGVWVGDGKIAAIGVAARKWITYHGFAINVSTDLTFFGTIVPCGIREFGVTSMEKVLGVEINIEQVKQSLVKNFAEFFDFKKISEESVNYELS